MLSEEEAEGPWHCPPFCPKTKEAFPETRLVGPYITCTLHPDGHCLSSFFEEDRRFIGRYQACAWIDRAERWLRLSDHWLYSHWNLGNQVHMPRQVKCQSESQRCLAIAESWREWERADPDTYLYFGPSITTRYGFRLTFTEDE